MEKDNIIDFGMYSKVGAEASPASANQEVPVSKDLQSAIEELIRRLRNQQPLMV
ncbi:MAG: hypothetical protein P4M14_03700 [Gammaproteobacteria bacterium]|nr:hypothetical protein [Gammaproteobacteria bacterium]